MLVNMRKILICVICVCMSVCMIQPTEIYAANEADSETETQNEAKIKYEDMTLRDESSKTYVMSDGSMQKILYSIPVHYEEENEWKEIDNILIDESSEEAFVIDDDSRKIDYTYDGLNRMSGKSINTTNAIVTSYAYKNRDSNITTNMLASETVGGIEYTYGYDILGNIASIETDDWKIEYQYDIYSRLVRENNPTTGKTVTYRYDDNGNILERKEYSYTTDANLSSRTPTAAVSYSYASGTDRLTSYNNQTVTNYDNIGNPRGYRGYTLEWSGRELSSIKQGNTALSSYSYDSGGIRKSKIVDGQETKYITVDGKVIEETGPDGTLIYSYDDTGHLVKIMHKIGSSSADYYVACNSRGDTEALYNASGSLTARYTYDSWGKTVSIKDASGNTITDSNSIANLNPIRYRGYYYDKESGYYYLNSRYYDPEVGRFISADTTDVLSVLPTTLTDKNLYAYCDNNPVIRKDITGCVWETAFDVGSLVLSVVEVALNPTDVMAWAGMVGDAVDLVPFVTGV